MATASTEQSLVENVETPCLLVSLDRVTSNCENMLERCRGLGVSLRPMMKTHKTIEAATIMTGGPMKGIECSTLKECEFYADAKFDDILWTGIFTLDKIPRMKALHERLDLFHVMVDDLYGVQLLAKNPTPSGTPWSVFLMVNVGGNRSGVIWNSFHARAVARGLKHCKHVQFKGLYGHEGHVYLCDSKDEINEASDTAANRIITLARVLQDEGIPVPIVGLGSTPSCSQPGGNMADIDEFHPGNYVFYDCMQAMKGACGWDDIAARVATRVTGHYPESGQILVDAGFMALSMDGQGAFGEKGSYCLIEGHPELKMVNLNQEVGFIQAVGPDPIACCKYPIGSLLFLLPWHSCATACAFDKYLVHRGENITAEWKTCSYW